MNCKTKLAEIRKGIITVAITATILYFIRVAIWRFVSNMLYLSLIIVIAALLLLAALVANRYYLNLKGKFLLFVFSLLFFFFSVALITIIALNDNTALSNDYIPMYISILAFLLSGVVFPFYIGFIESRILKRFHFISSLSH
jgi:hypothetical protein